MYQSGHVSEKQYCGPELPNKRGGITRRRKFLSTSGRTARDHWRPRPDFFRHVYFTVKGDFISFVCLLQLCCSWPPNRRDHFALKGYYVYVGGAFGRKLYLFGNRYTEPKDQLVVFSHLYLWVHLEMEFWLWISSFALDLHSGFSLLTWIFILDSLLGLLNWTRD